MPNDDGSEIHDPSYETGYREGGSNATVDWLAALSDEFELEPFDGPQDFIQKLRAVIENNRARTVDFRKILMAYIELVGTLEGVDYVEEIETLSSEENGALFEAAAEANKRKSPAAV